ncbi:MAG: hypothetical protein LiPW39_74 [Parcubacteria group bacterium LiPW_39]|nr:MAG: hypothetical protein LiPW39_74 [Parcubacteria group bacterium LiPW_39]
MLCFSVLNKFPLDFFYRNSRDFLSSNDGFSITEKKFFDKPSHLIWIEPKAQNKYCFIGHIFARCLNPRNVRLSLKQSRLGVGARANLKTVSSFGYWQRKGFCDKI